MRHVFFHEVSIPPGQVEFALTKCKNGNAITWQTKLYASKCHLTLSMTWHGLPKVRHGFAITRIWARASQSGSCMKLLGACTPCLTSVLAYGRNSKLRWVSYMPVLARKHDEADELQRDPGNRWRYDETESGDESEQEPGNSALAVFRVTVYKYTAPARHLGTLKTALKLLMGRLPNLMGR